MGCYLSKKAVNPTREFIPGYQFKGEVIFREFSSKEDYDEHKYQYATTSFADELMQPAIIAYAADEEDIMQVIKFATGKNVAVSIRTGENDCLIVVIV
jgi:hypothetical protein